MNSSDSAKLHMQAVVVDAVCPLPIEDPSYLDWYRAGGVSVVAPTVGSFESSEVVLRRLSSWHTLLRERADVMLVRRHNDFLRAKQTKRLGLFFHLQGTDPIDRNLDLIDLYKSLGVGMIQLTYNCRNHVGDGCEEPGNAGLSRFGLEVVRRLNRARVVVDCSHCGLRTSLDAIHHSARPVVLSHSNVKAVRDNPRNVSDELIRAIAQSGGVIGVVGFPAMVADTPRPTMDDFIAHIDAIVERVGIDHVGLGIDYYAGQAGVLPDDVALKNYEEAIASGLWSTAYPPPPHYYPAGMDRPQLLPALTKRLLEMGYREEDVLKILGQNWMRVIQQIWG